MSHRTLIVEHESYRTVRISLNAEINFGFCESIGHIDRLDNYYVFR